jgi:hypothetical protein
VRQPGRKRIGLPDTDIDGDIWGSNGGMDIGADESDGAHHNLNLAAIFKDMGEAALTDVQNEASQEAAGDGPKYRSSPSSVPAYEGFEGDFFPTSDDTELAIFSDDGVSVYVDGVPIHEALNQEQDLPDLNESLHVLQFDWEAGEKYHIVVDYSNVSYTGSSDIDGCTLFAYSGGGSINPALHISGPSVLRIDQQGTFSATTTPGRLRGHAGMECPGRHSQYRVRRLHHDAVRYPGPSLRQLHHRA